MPLLTQSNLVYALLPSKALPDKSKVRLLFSLEKAENQIKGWITMRYP